MGEPRLSLKQRFAIRRVAQRIYGNPKHNNHHWTRLNKCANALENFDWDEDKAVEHILQVGYNRR